MKILKLAALVSLLSQPFFAYEMNDFEFQAGFGYEDDYIFRGMQRSDNSVYKAHMNLDFGNNFKTSFEGRYDTSMNNFVTDYDSNWMEWRSTLSYDFENSDHGTWTAGYTFYAFQDRFFNTSEVFVKYKVKDSKWNPAFTVYYDFDFNDGAYYTAEIERVHRDREWEYAFGLKAGAFASYGSTVNDRKQVRGVTYANPFNGNNNRSGLADLVPSIRLTRHMDEESALSLWVKTSLILESDSYVAADMAKDEFTWGLSYQVQF